MTLAGTMMLLVGLFWGVGGAIWLLMRRKYRLDQIPQFLMDLVGFPVELAQAVFGRGGVPYALLLPNMLSFGFFTFAPMNLLHYQAQFPAKATRTVEVTYSQYAFVDTGAPRSYQLAYVVHPASLWREFGPIRLEVAVPEGVPFRASVPCERQGSEERELPRGPWPRPRKDQKLRFDVYGTTLADKTGELFMAIDAEAWGKLQEETSTKVVAERGAP